MCDKILIGKIIGPHGIKGALRVYSFAESLSVYYDIDEFLIEDSKSLILARMELLWVNSYKKGIRLALKGVDNRDDAERLVGSNIYVEKSVLPILEQDTYFWSDLLNMSVRSVRGRVLGRLDSIISTGSNDVYVVKSLEQNVDSELLIPAIKSVVIDVNLVDKVMLIDLPDDLE